MLVLSRTPNEQIKIHDAEHNTTIIIDVVEVKGRRVRLGITAPAHCVITRPEVHEDTVARATS